MQAKTSIEGGLVVLSARMELDRMPREIGDYLEASGSVLRVETRPESEGETQTVMTVLVGVDGLKAEGRALEAPGLRELHAKIPEMEPDVYDGRWYWTAGGVDDVRKIARAWLSDVTQRFPRIQVEDATEYHGR